LRDPALRPSKTNKKHPSFLRLARKMIKKDMFIKNNELLKALSKEDAKEEPIPELKKFDAL
jgi:hypothetical protein